MTVLSQGTSVVYDGDGESTVFAFPYRYADPEDIKVIVGDPESDPETWGAPNYTVAGDGDSATVTITSAAPPADKKVLVYRDTVLTQETNYEAGDFPSSTHERNQDQDTLVSQELAAQLARAIRFSRFSDPIDPLPILPPGTVLIIGPDGQPGAGPDLSDLQDLIDAINALGGGDGGVTVIVRTDKDNVFTGSVQTVQGPTPTWQYYAPDNPEGQQLARIRLANDGRLTIAYGLGAVSLGPGGVPLPAGGWSTAAAFDPTGAAMAGGFSIVTREKGDDRYSLFEVGFQALAPEADEEVLYIPIPPATLPADMAGSRVNVATPPETGAIVLSVQRNETEVGTITIATDGGATWATTGNEAQDWVGGATMLRLVMPADMDGCEGLSGFLQFRRAY